MLVLTIWLAGWAVATPIVAQAYYYEYRREVSQRGAVGIALGSCWAWPILLAILAVYFLIGGLTRLIFPNKEKDG